MKKHVKKLVVLLLLVVFATSVVALAACANSTNGVAGTYYYWNYDRLDKTQYYTLKSGKWINEAGESGEYEVSGTSITLYIEFFGSREEYFNGTVIDGVLTLNFLGSKMFFYKDGKQPSEGTTSNQTPSTKNKYIVTYDANGGAFADINTFTQEVEEGSKLTAPTSPTRNNYTFAGWAKNKIGSEMWKFDEDTVTEDTTLYAQWTQESAVILSVDGASMDGTEIYMFVTHDVDSVSLSNKVVCSDDSIWKLYYDRMGQTEVPTKVAAGMSGHLANGENTFYIVVTSQNGAQVNLYELTVYRSYAVNVNYYDGYELLKSETTYTGLAYTANYKPSITGYTFNGWRDGSGKAFTSDTLWGATVLYADKTANMYTANLNVNGGDALTETAKTLTYGSSYSLPVPTRTGYSFTGWYVGNTQVTNSNGRSLVEWNYAGTTTVTAHWQANEYKLTLTTNISNAGFITGDDNYLYGSEITIYAITYIGYRWIGWYDGTTMLTDEQEYTFTMGLDTSYKAHWEELDEMKNFTYTSTEDTCVITGVKDNSIKEIVFPEYITRISSFTDCLQLETIYWNAVYCDTVVGMNGYRFFSGCSSLSTVVIGENVTHIDCSLFSDCAKLTTVYWNATECRFAGYYYGSLFSKSPITTVVLADNVQIIPPYTFLGCVNIETFIIIQNSQLNTIGNGVFGSYHNSGDMLKLKNIVIPVSVNTIGDTAFLSCTNLENVYYCGSETQWNQIDIGSKNNYLTDATRYYYSNEVPSKNGNYWHWAEDGITPEIWTHTSNNTTNVTEISINHQIECIIPKTTCC